MWKTLIPNFVVLSLGLLCGPVVQLISAEFELLEANVSDLENQGALDVRSMGSDTSPEGNRLGYNERYLTWNEDPWMPVMGEYHFSRYDAKSWELELRKMKAGGIDVVATYVFWIHHEEEEGQWDWSDSRNLREFVLAAKRAGLQVFLRIGPWCHGEVRNGGLPDWIMHGDWKVRSNDAAYLEKVVKWYDAIGEQVNGLMWKDGGPVVGTQLDNEFHGPAAHLLTLKELAIEAGFDTPYYTKTGWPKLTDQMPFGEMIPLFGVYAEGFWNHSLEPMPGKYREGFHFSKVRTSSDIGSDQLGSSLSEDEEDAQRYPYLTCEVGGGMMNSYHRRVLIETEDVESNAMVKLGSGGNLLGYYMYHGGWNPEGKITSLQESLVTRYPNDMPVRNYDFQAPLGAAGTLRDHYHGLKLFHLFIRDYQSWIGDLQTFLPEQRPTGLDDVETFRWSVRSNGEGGLVFFNNYERLQTLAQHRLKFTLKGLSSGEFTFPSSEVVIDPGTYGYWPFRMEIAPGFSVEWVTAQPICRIQLKNGDWVAFFKQTEGIPAELAVSESDTNSVNVIDDRISIETDDGLSLIESIPVGTVPRVSILNPVTEQQCHVVVLDEGMARNLWKGEVDGETVVLLTDEAVVFDGDSMQLRATDAGDPSMLMIPKITSVNASVGGSKIESSLCNEGFWSHLKFAPAGNAWQQIPATVVSQKAAGPVREIPMGPFKGKVAMAPVDADFEDAASWKLELPGDEMLSDWQDVVLEINYRGDVLRVSGPNGLWMDDFYNGRPFELTLRAMANSEGYEVAALESLQLELLPLTKQAPIYLHPKIRAELESDDVFCELESVKWILSNPMKIEIH